MGSKQKDLETHACLQDCHLINTMEPWWNGSYDQNGWLQALQEGQAGKMRKKCCPLRKCTDRMHGAPSEMDEELTESSGLNGWAGLSG